MSQQPSTKSPRMHPAYELLYHPEIPGRGEFIRLAFEAAGVPYTDIGNDSKAGYSIVQKICMNDSSLESSDGDPPVFAPPALRVPGVGKDGNKALVISQTSNILFYLADKLGLAPSDDEDENAKYHVNQIVLTALDLNNEVHDSHHPIASMLYYEEQKPESLRKSKDVRENRIPKFYSYFERTLKGNAAGQGKYFVGSKLTTADLTVWQVVDGIKFAFPKESAQLEKKFPQLMVAFYRGLREEKGVKEYLASERRLPYGMGVFRHYPELDRQV